MAREVTRFEARTDPPTIHPTLQEAVTAELAALMGWRSGGDEGVPALARKLVDQAEAAIACLGQMADAPRVDTIPSAERILLAAQSRTLAGAAQ